MERIAFCLRIRKGAEEAYEKAHREVWPEMLALLKSSGISEYSIFRRNELLFLYLHVEEDFNVVWGRVDRDPVNRRWQRAMAPYFEPMESLRPGERLPMMREVFYMP